MTHELRNIVMNFPHGLYLRNETSDIPTFRQVFQELQYDIPLDFIPEVIIDAGANIGLASVYFKNRFPAASIIAIEPESSNFDLLIKNTEKYNDVHCIKAGIWHSDSQLQIVNANVADKWEFMVEEVKVGTHLSVPAISIMKIIKDFGIKTIDVLKIDIEGSEKELFEKNTELWLPKVKVLIIELHDRMRYGCTESVFSAINSYQFSMIQKHENLIFYFKHHTHL